MSAKNQLDWVRLPLSKKGFDKYMRGQKKAIFRELKRYPNNSLTRIELAEKLNVDAKFLVLPLRELIRDGWVSENNFHNGGRKEDTLFFRLIPQETSYRIHL